MTKQQKRRRFADWLAQLMGWNSKTRQERRIRVEPLEKRELMAGDLFSSLLGSTRLSHESTASESALVSTVYASSASTGSLQALADSNLGSNRLAEGEPANDLVAFAKAIAATNTKFYGADWCPICTEQKALFQDGAQYLPFIEVTNPDRTPNSTATANNITSYPTWVFADGSRLVGSQSLATLAAKVGIAIPQSETPYIAEIGSQNVAVKSPLMVAVDGYSPNGRPLTYTVSSSNPAVITASMNAATNRSLKVTTEGYGEMIFKLFEDEAARPTSRVIELANQNFYDNLTFHRIVSSFVIQGGDPNGNGTGGSTLPDFNDQFNLNLLHNQSGILSFAKSSDDTNNSQFFITADATPGLDFNHSVFGKLTDGEKVRQGIQRIPAIDANGTARFKPKMTDVSVFNDTENALIVLKNVASSGTSTITVTATDDSGRTFSRSFTATVAADSSNRSPFLNDIPTLQATAAQPFSFTLTSQDREGDAPIYGVSKITSGDYTPTVNPQTGVVTFTPPVGFSGPLQFRATVRQSATSITNEGLDGQVVTVNVSSNALALALSSVSDSGKSNSDGLTNATNLSFSVTGTTSGALVEILNGTTVVGTATASSTTTSIPVNASSLSGNVQFTARQTLNGQSTATATPLSLNLDRTAPAQISAKAVPTNAVAGTALSINLSHPEEGSGLTYALQNAPAGATINASTGVIQWTPQTAQLGSQSLNVVATDDAGNSTNQTFNLNVIENPKLRMSLAIVGLDGNPISSVQAGQQFKVRIRLQDLRAGSAARGVFSAYSDLTFDSAIIKPIDTNPISYISPYTAAKSGTVGEGVIDELGAVGSLDVTGPEERSIVEVTFVALTSGNAFLRLDPADSVDNETTLYSDNEGNLTSSQIEFGTASLTIGANYQVVNDVLNFDEDSTQKTLNVLSNDTAASGVVLTIVGFSTPSKNGTVTIASDGKTLLYTPAANVNGVETFTYTVANEQNVRQTATVTVQLTDINDPPVANNDSFTAIANSTVNTFDVLANDSKGVDASSTETLTITQVSTGSQGGTIERGTSGLNVRYTPKSGFTGTETFTYTISDGRAGTSVGTVTVLVNPAVPSPTANPDTFTITEDADQASFDVVANDTPSTVGNTLTLDSVRPSTNGSSVSVANGRLVYKPAANLSGQEVISYVLRESNGGTTSGNVTFNITNVNDAPVAVADTLSVNSTVGNSAINVLANDTDPDTADNLVISSITQPETGKGTLAISGDQKTINYTPPSNTFEGSFSFSYTVRDTAGLTSTTTANITVQRFTPRAIAGKVMLSNAGLKQIQVTLSGTTSSGTPITQTATSNSDGSFSFGELAPGNYKLKRDALPFLNDQSQEVTIQSGPNDGNHTADLQVSGSLHSKYVDVRDFLGSSRRKTLTAVINNSTGATRWIAPKGDWANLSTLGFQVNTNDLTLNAANATASNLTAKVPFTNTLLSRTTEGDVTLVRLRGASTKFNLAAPTTQSSSSTLEAEGESATSAVSSSQANPVTTSQIPSTTGATNNSMLQSILGSSRRRSNPATSADNTTQSGSSDSNQS